MFCPECGAKNQDDAVFCENCGADISQALAQSEPSQQDQANIDAQQSPVTYTPISSVPQDFTYQPAASAVAVKRVPMKKRTKVLIAAIFLIIILLAVLFNIGKQLSSPDKIAKDYFKTLSVQDWDKAYSYLDITESDFINKDNFIKTQKKSKDISKIVNYSVVSDDTTLSTTDKTDKLKNALTETITMQYITQDSTSPQTMEINLIKQPEKKFLFFDTWKVASAGYITPKISITVPQGTTAFLDGVQIADKYKDTASADSSDSTNSQDSASQPVTYTVKNIFSGTYTLKVTSKYTEDYTNDITVNGEDSAVNVDSLKLKQEILDTVAKQPEQVLKALYSSALAGKDFDSVKSYFVSNSDTQSNMESQYGYLQNSIAKDNNGGFKSISFSNFKPEVTNSQADSSMSITVDTQFDYAYTAVDTTYDAAAPAQEYSGNNSGNIEAVFQLEGDKWLISGLSQMALSSSNNYY